MSVQFEYPEVGSKLVGRLTDLISGGTSVTLLAPSYGGKNYLTNRIRQELDQRKSGAYVFVDPDGEIKTLRQLLRYIAGEAESCGREIGKIVNDFWLSRGKPLTLLFPNVEALPDAEVQTLLQQVRELVDQKKLIVLLGGSQVLSKFVHGPNSVYACSHQFVLQGYEREEFERLIQRYLPQYSFTLLPEAIEAIWRATGGRVAPMKAVFSHTVELRARYGRERGEAVGLEQLGRIPNPTAMAVGGFRSTFADADTAISQDREAWLAVEELLRNPVAGIPAPVSPGVLSLSALIRTQAGRLYFSSPIAVEYAIRRYTPRYFADLHALNGEWEEAFDRYAKLPLGQWVRPENSMDRLEVEPIVNALGVALAAANSPGDVLTLFRNGMRFLLGFGELSRWRLNETWHRMHEDGGEFPKEKDDEFRRAIPRVTGNKSQLLEVREPWSRFALAATTKVFGKNSPEIVCLSDAAMQRSISQDRLKLARRLFEAFLPAYEHECQIAFLEAKLERRADEVKVLDSILEAIGLANLTRRSICTTVAKGLRKFGYRRVMISLVDLDRRRIRGVFDSSDQLDAGESIDVAKLTNYSLSEPSQDCQPRVVWSGKPHTSGDAAKYAYANPQVCRLARQKGFGVIPILDTDGEVLGTIHVEREDGEEPSREEVDELTAFGQRLAMVLERAERMTYVNQCLDRLPDAIAVADRTMRWRYSNGAAAALLKIEKGWKRRVAAPEVSRTTPLHRLMLRGITDGPDGSDQPTTEKLAGTSSYVQVAPLRDDDHETNGALAMIRDFTRVDSLVERIGEVIRAGSSSAAMDALLRLMEHHLGHPQTRIYRVQRTEGRDRLVSFRGIGLPTGEDRAEFDEGGIVLSPRDENHHSWKCIEGRAALVFVWLPNSADGTEHFTPTGIRATIVREPEHKNRLGKKPGDFWIDLPLFSADGRPIGKLATHIQGSLEGQQFWILQILASLFSAVLEMYTEIDQKQEWMDVGYQKSLATIAHHLLNRVALLDPIHFRYKDAERHPDRLSDVNADFGVAIRTLTAVITRARDFLKNPQPKPRRFDIAALCRSLVATNFPEGQAVFDGPANLEVVADPELISNAIAEVLTNARRAVAKTEEPRVVVTMKCLPNFVEVHIGDNGPGIQVVPKERVFADLESFWADGRGSGLGLGWSRRVMRAHDGDLAIADSRTGGACFELILPLSKGGLDGTETV